jgi:hypothetical protein
MSGISMLAGFRGPYESDEGEARRKPTRDRGRMPDRTPRQGYRAKGPRMRAHDDDEQDERDGR